jgi:hypothetical protein
MDVIGFVCISLQLHDSLGSRRACPCLESDFSSQNGNLIWGIYYRRAKCCCAFVVGKRTTFCKGYSCFLFMVRSVYRVKRFSTGSKNSLKDVRKSQMIPDRAVLLRLQFIVICYLFTDSSSCIRINERISKSTFLAFSLRCFWSTRYENYFIFGGCDSS